MINSAQLPAVSQTLQNQAFLHGNIGALFKSDPTRCRSWNNFAQSWYDLKQDEYMGDGGTYRFRRFSEFELDQTTRALSPLPHGPYRQSKEDNYLNGDINRLYWPMLDCVQSNEAFRQVLFGFADVMTSFVPASNWLVQVFQNPILATNGCLGKPTPEGVHRDGVDFVLSLMIDRGNVDGGESFTYAQDGKTLLASVTMKNAGDFIFLNDQLMKHSVQPISRTDPVKVGYRDVLIAMFTQRSKESV